MVAEVAVMEVAVTAEITGGMAIVAKVALLDVAERLKLFAETTSKLYVVPGMSPVRVTEWAVVGVLFKGDCDP